MSLWSKLHLPVITYKTTNSKTVYEYRMVKTIDGHYWIDRKRENSRFFKPFYYTANLHKAVLRLYKIRTDDKERSKKDLRNESKEG